jgi:hypothetical protein
VSPVRRAQVAALACVVGWAVLAAACGGKSTPPAESAQGGEAAAGDKSGAAADAAPGTPTGGSGATAAAVPGADAPANAPADGATAPNPAAEEGAIPAPDGKGPASAPAEPNHREVVLFFQREDDDSLGPERRRILLTPSVSDQARQIVNELIAGPEAKGLLPTMPPRTTVLGVYLDRAGTAYVDLSDEFVSMHPGGSSAEMATVFSVVDSLAYNLPEVRRVRFLVAGEERDTLHSHLDLRRAYLKNMSMVRMEDGG